MATSGDRNMAIDIMNRTSTADIPKNVLRISAS